MSSIRWADKVKSISYLIICLALFLSACADKKLNANSLLNKDGPKLHVEEWVSEKPNLEGKFILIDFWATWCAPCRFNIPRLNEFHEKYKDKLVVIGLSSEETKLVKIFKNKVMTIDYYLAVDSRQRTSKKIGLYGIPHVLVIDPKGIVRWEGNPLKGRHNLTDSKLKKIFDSYAL